MVNKNYIESIQSLEKNQISALDKLWIDKMLIKYPCFHGMFLLQGIYLKQHDEEDYEQALPNIAAHVNDRTVLYDLVHRKYGGIKSKKSTPQISKIGDVKEDVLVPKEPVKEENSEDLKSLVQAIRSNRKKQTSPQAKKRSPRNIEGSVNKNKSKAKTDKQIAPKKRDQAKKIPVANSFTEWLRNQKSVDLAGPSQVPIDPVVSREAELILEAKRSSFKLEDFLVNQIQRKQSKKEGASETNIHAVSETYAKILVNQGKLEQAIGIYKELSIKYPKKSSIFARQIENLKLN